MNRHERHLISKQAPKSVGRYLILLERQYDVLIAYEYGWPAEGREVALLAGIPGNANCWWVDREGNTQRDYRDPEFETPMTIEDCHESI